MWDALQIKSDEHSIAQISASYRSPEPSADRYIRKSALSGPCGHPNSILPHRDCVLLDNGQKRGSKGTKLSYPHLRVGVVARYAGTCRRGAYPNRDNNQKGRRIGRRRGGDGWLRYARCCVSSTCRRMGGAACEAVRGGLQRVLH